MDEGSIAKNSGDMATSTTHGETESHSAESRDELITTAIKFLQNPKVKQSSIAQKRAFLLKKGLVEDEIQKAFVQAGTYQDEEERLANLKTIQPQVIANTALLRSQQVVVPPSKLYTFRNISCAVIVLGGAAYGLYALYKKYVIPWLRGLPSDEERLDKLGKEMTEFRIVVGESLNQLNKTVQALSTSMSLHHQRLEDILSQNQSGGSDKDWQYVQELKQEIQSLKGILLSRKSFPSTPSLAGLPSWQLTSANNSDTTSADTPAVVNGYQNNDDGDTSGGVGDGDVVKSKKLLNEVAPLSMEGSNGVYNENEAV